MRTEEPRLAVGAQHLFAKKWRLLRNPGDMASKIHFRYLAIIRNHRTTGSDYLARNSAPVTKRPEPLLRTTTIHYLCKEHGLDKPCSCEVISSNLMRGASNSSGNNPTQVKRPNQGHDR